MAKQYNARIQHKIDTWENWSKAENFFPLEGEIIIYTTDKDGNEKLGLKIGNGDGITNVHNLPFLQSNIEFIQSDWAQTDNTKPDYIKNKPIYNIIVNQETGKVEQLLDEIVAAAQSGMVLVCAGALSLITDNVMENGSYAMIQLTIFALPNTIISANIYADGTVEMELSDNMQMKSDRVTSISEESTDMQYPTAKAVYEALQNIDIISDWEDIQNKPEDLSDFNNDLGFQTETQVLSAINSKASEIEAKIPTIPTNVSAFTNDAGYQTAQQVNNAIANKQDIQVISNKGNTNTETWYFPLGQMVIDNSGNFGNYTFTGRFGGWIHSNTATYTIMLMNRGNYDGNIITSTVSASGQVDVALGLTDIVVAKNDDLSHTVYLKCNGYFCYDFSYTTYQHSIIYNGQYLTTAPNNIIWTLSDAPKTILSADGSFSATGGIEIPSHTHSASEINSGILSTDRLPTITVAKGGTGYTSITDTTYTADRYRASSLNSSEVNPTINGVIAWMYE